jgi:hypothetical protein
VTDKHNIGNEAQALAATEIENLQNQVSRLTINQAFCIQTEAKKDLKIGTQ